MRTVTAAFTEAIAQSHRIAVLVEVLDSGLVTATINAVTAGGVTLDAQAQTRGRLDLTVVDDGTLGLIPLNSTSDLAPYGNELRVKRGVTYPNGSKELIGLGVFRIDETNTDDGPTGAIIQITGQDRSARIIDARFDEPYQIAAGTNYATAILDTIRLIYPDVAYKFATTSRTTPLLVAAEGDDRWKFCQDMAAAIGMTLYFDGDGRLILRPITPSANPVATIAEGSNGVLVRAARRWTRQGTFNRVVATGENTGQTAPARGVATDLNPNSPTYYYGPFGKVPRFYVSPFIVTDAQAADAAQGILTRELGTTQQVTFGSVVNPALEPDDVVRIVRARSGIDENHVLSSLTIPLAVDQELSSQTRATQVTA